VKERAAAGVVLTVLGEAAVDVGEARADAVLVPLQGGEVDGVGEVRGEEFVALGFEPGLVRGEVGDLLVLAGAAFVERGIDLGCEASVVVLADRDAPVGVFDEPFGDLDGYRASGAGGFLGGAAGADEVGVGGATGVGGEVEQHAGAAGAAVQQPFEVVRVLDVTGCVGVAGVEERLHLVEQLGFDQWFMCAGVQRTFVADHSRVVGVGEQLVEGVLSQRLRGPLRRRNGRQPTRGQFT